MRVNKILFITLSNIGDAILTLPALDYLRESFPLSEITVLSGIRPKEIFQDNPTLNKFIIYDKHCRLREKIRLFTKLKNEKFDIICDLRNSLFGLLLPARYKISPFLSVPRNIRHMKDRHLYKAKKCMPGMESSGLEHMQAERRSLHVQPRDKEYIDNALKENNIKKEDILIVVASGARSHIKRWPGEKFAGLVLRLIKDQGAKVVLAGDRDDTAATQHIAAHAGFPLLDLAGRTTIPQLFYLLRISKLLVTNDSAVLHLAGYADMPVLAIFGPTDEAKYGPWSQISAVVKKDIFCRPCQKAQCRFGTLECMALIGIGDVFRQIKMILSDGYVPQASRERVGFKRILIVRTDRIGDVLLSTPVIKALRDTYPHAYIAMMVSEYAKDIIEGNPYLDSAVIYDKDLKDKGWWRLFNFILALRRKRFDLAVILHPTNRVHLMTFLAGIPRRIGYNRKLGILLTDRLKHTKQFGEKHELDYNLDLLKYLGIELKDKALFMPLKAESEGWVEDLFRREGISKEDHLLAIHPGASCISKVWPLERFSEVADRLVKKYGCRVLLIAGKLDTAKAEEVARGMHYPVINLAGKTSVSQLASVLKRCRLFISNDSGPVHIASGLGTPVIAIFGRSQKGLSPLRWGPTSKSSRVAYQPVGCIECLAHNCIRDFICLKAVSVDYVLHMADALKPF